MDAFWKIYCKLDESERKNALYEYLGKHISKNLNPQNQPNKFLLPNRFTNPRTNLKKKNKDSAIKYNKN